MKGLKQPAVDDQAILDDPDAEGMRKQKLAEEKAAAIERGEQAKPAADAGPVSEASQKVIDDYNDAWKEHNEKQDRTKCQAPDGTPLPCEQVLTNAEEILDTANKEAEKFEKEANAAPQGDPTAKDYVGLPLAEKGFVPEAVSADYDQSESFFFPPPPSAPPVLEVPDDDEDEVEEKQELSFKDFLKVKKAKDTFEQGDESTWYKDPPPDEAQEKEKSDFAKKSSSPFEEFNGAKDGSSQEHQGLLRGATEQQQEAAAGPTFGQQAAEARRNSESGGFSGSLRPPGAASAPVATQELVVPY